MDFKRQTVALTVKATEKALRRVFMDSVIAALFLPRRQKTPGLEFNRLNIHNILHH